MEETASSSPLETGPVHPGLQPLRITHIGSPQTPTHSCGPTLHVPSNSSSQFFSPAPSAIPQDALAAAPRLLKQGWETMWMLQHGTSSANGHTYTVELW